MSAFEQTALVLTDVQRERGQAGFVAVFEHLVEHYGLVPDLKDRVARLEFGPSNEWIATSSVDDEEKSLADLIAEHRWLRIDGVIPIDRKMHTFELSFYPASDAGDRAGLLLSLDATAYRAVYGGQPTYYGLYNAEARSGLIALCLGVTHAYGADGFLYDFDPGELVRLTEEGLSQRLLKPVVDPPGKGPGLIAGIRKSIVARQDLEAVWGASHINETTTGYLFLALLFPDDKPSASALKKLGSED
jgi:hypothetical protein